MNVSYSIAPRETSWTNYLWVKNSIAMHYDALNRLGCQTRCLLLYVGHGFGVEFVRESILELAKGLGS